MRFLIILLFCLSVLYAGVFSVTQSLLTESIPLLLLGAALLFSLIRYNDLNNAIRNSDRRHMLFFFIVLIYATMRSLLSPVFDYAIQDLFLILGAGITYFIVVVVFDTKNLCVIGILAGFILIINMLLFEPSFNAYVDALLGQPLGEWNTGLYNHRNFFSNMMMMCSLVLGSIAIFSVYSIWVRVLCLSLSVAGSIGVITSLSRAGFLGLIVGFITILVAFLMTKKRLPKLVFYGMGLVTLTVSMFIFSSIYGKIIEQRSEVEGQAFESQFSARLYYFAMAVEQFVEAPIIGNGSRSYIYESYGNYSDQLFYGSLNHGHVHNEFLQVLCEYGVIGFLLLVGFLFYHIVRGVMVLRRLILNKGSPDSDLCYLIAGLSIIIGGCFNMMFSFPAHCLPNLIFFVIGLGLVARCFNTHSEDEVSLHSRSEVIVKFKYQFKLLQYLVMLGVVGLSFVYGINEVKAAVAFLKSGIRVDDLTWKVEDKEKWKSVLEEVCVYAPTHDRLDKLGAIYLDDYHIALDDEQKKDYWSKAMRVFQESKQRHLYGPISRVNIARLWQYAGDFSSADEEYRSAESLAKLREYHLHLYENWAHNSNLWGLELARNEDYTLAAEKLEDGLKYVKLSKMAHENKVTPSLATVEFNLSKILLSLYYKAGNIEKSQSFLDEYLRPLAKGKIRYITDKEPLSQHTEIMFNYGFSLWAANDIEKSKSVLTEVQQQYHIIKVEVGLKEEDKEQLEMVANMLDNIEARLK